MSNMGELIKDLRLKHHMTLEEFGNKVGVGKSTVRKWENGMIANMKRDKIAKVAEVFGVSPAYLMGYEDSVPISPSISNQLYSLDLQSLPLLGEIACGNPIFINEDRESYVMTGTRIHADFCLKARGDSMINARILDGDIVFIRKQSQVENGEIAAVIIDNEVLLKRLYFENGVVTLISENPKYPPKVFTGEILNHIKVLGKAIAFQSDVK